MWRYCGSVDMGITGHHLRPVSLDDKLNLKTVVFWNRSFHYFLCTLHQVHIRAFVWRYERCSSGGRRKQTALGLTNLDGPASGNFPYPGVFKDGPRSRIFLRPSTYIHTCILALLLSQNAKKKSSSTHTFEHSMSKLCPVFDPGR